MIGGLLLYVQLFFHDFQHHPGTQLKAILEDQAVSDGLIEAAPLYAVLKIICCIRLRCARAGNRDLERNGKMTEKIENMHYR